MPGNTSNIDGPGANARFSYPEGVAVDNAGNCYVADANNATIRKITPNQLVSTLAGSPGQSGTADGFGGTARFGTPMGVAVDAAGNVYVADYDGHTVRKIVADGTVTTIAGSPGVKGSSDGIGSVARFNTPSGVAVDRSGNVYVAELSNYTVRKITPDGMVTTLAGSAQNGGSTDGPGDQARFYLPFGLTVDDNGSVYVADFGNSTIRKISPDGTVTTFAGLAGAWGSSDGVGNEARFANPSGVAADKIGNVYVADQGNSTIRLITPDGVVSTVAGSPGAVGSVDGTWTEARFSFPRGLAVGPAGEILVADRGNSTIRELKVNGDVLTIAGEAGSPSTDGLGTKARFANPYDVAVDAAGTMYVADADNALIRKISSDGMVTTLAGRLGTGVGFNVPTGVAVDRLDNVYVADYYNHTIRKITPDGNVSVFAGSTGRSGTADGTGSGARFNFPIRVAVDTVGTVYVSDYYNHTIRKVTADGVVRTLAGHPGLAGSSDGLGINAQFSNPNGIAVDRAGTVYVADEGNRTIRRITADGLVSTLAGTNVGPYGYGDGLGQDALFSSPQGLALDSEGNIYVVEVRSNIIRKITPAGLVRTIGGKPFAVGGSTDGVGDQARFSGPCGIAVDAAGNIYIADSSNNRLSKGVVMPRIVGLVRMGQSELKLIVNASGTPPDALVLESSGTLTQTTVWQTESNALFSASDAGDAEVKILLDTGPRFYRIRIAQ